MAFSQVVRAQESPATRSGATPSASKRSAVAQLSSQPTAQHGGGQWAVEHAEGQWCEQRHGRPGGAGHLAAGGKAQPKCCNNGQQHRLLKHMQPQRAQGKPDQLFLRAAQPLDCGGGGDGVLCVAWVVASSQIKV